MARLANSGRRLHRHAYRLGRGCDEAGQPLTSFGFDVEINLSITDVGQFSDPFPGSVIIGRRVAR